MLCQKICVTNHIQVQLSVGVLNGWLGYGSTHPVILKTINLWSYTSLIWLNHITRSLWCDIAWSVSQSAHLRYSEWSWIPWSRNVIDNTRNVINNEFLHSFPNISIYTPWLTRTLTCVINNIVFCFTMFKSIYLKYLHSEPKFKTTISNDVWPHVFRSLVRLYLTLFSLHTWHIYVFFLYVMIFTYLKDRKVLESTMSWLLMESNQLQTGYYFTPNNRPNSK